MKNLIIIGAGGFGREVLSYIRDDNPIFQFKGFLDDRLDLLKDMLGEDKIISSPHKYVPKPDDVFMVAVGDPRAREKYTRVLRDQFHVDFATVVHPQANINRHAKIGRGCIIGPRCGVSVNVGIGNFTCIQEYTVVGHDAQIGNWCQINSHCTLAGDCVIGDFVTIHPNSVITSGSVVEDGVTVAAGSVVYGRIKSGMTVLGNPARIFRFK
jgi:sugar O-acyltransferase (sialic acid O-acetyltransferase NeuD family)